MSPTTFAHCTRVVLITTLLPLSSQATQLNIPDFPLFLTSVGVPPNLLITFDNSGSMQRSWMPDDVYSLLSDSGNRKRFASASVNGMYYNPRTTYRIPTRSDGVTYSTGFSNAWFNGFDTSRGPSSGLNLGTGYRIVGASSPSTLYSSGTFYGTAEAAFYYLYYLDKSSSTSTPSNCNGTRTDNDCYIKIVVGSADDIATGDTAAKKQNFANWYSFYRTRTLAVISGAMVSFDTVEDNKIRFGWQTINNNPSNTNCYIDGPGTTCPGYGTVSTTTNYNQTCNITFDKYNSNRYRIIINTATAPCNNFFSGIPDDTVVTVSGITTNPAYNGAYTVRDELSGKSVRVNESFSGIKQVDATLSWSKIDTSTITSENRLRSLDAERKTSFFNWLSNMNVSGGTPLRSALKRVGEYYRRTGRDSAYAEDPYINEGTLRACRKNFHLLFTDGLWNADSGYTTPGSNTNLDSTGTLTLGNSSDTPDPVNPVPTAYTPRAPYKDVSASVSASYTNSNGLADTALYYWATDLNPALANKIPPSMIDFTGSPNDQFWNPKNDPATWQHMVNYSIGLGLKQTLVKNCSYYNNDTGSYSNDPNNPTPGCPVWAGDTYAGGVDGYDGLKNGVRNWPKIDDTPGTNDAPDGHVYDLWHMAINSRGKFYSADSPDELVKAFQDVMNTISSTASSGGGARVSSNIARIQETNATAFVARFNADWSGTLQAFPIDPTEGTLGTTASWEAGSLIPPGNQPNGRKIFTRNGSVSQELTSCTGDLSTALNRKVDETVDNLCSQRLAWLRGYTAITGASWDSTTKRVTFTALNHGLKAGDAVTVTGVTSSVTVGGVTTTSTAYNNTYTVSTVSTDSFTVVETLENNPGVYLTDEADADRNNDDKVRYLAFRDRSSVLGDIMNSGTVYIHKEDLGYGNANITLTGGGDAYKTYLTTKAGRTPVVYVGANDGMLHAFNAQVSGANMGKELFAYVPAGVYGNLSALTEPTYAKFHKYFVDGTPTVRDVYIDGGWKTYLVGGLRAGGKSVYALDLSNVSSTNGFTASDIKWEFTEIDLGLTFSQPQIAAISADRWVAIFGNGYNSTAEKAYLYIVDLSDGSQIAKIATDNTISNGLSTPYPFDSNGDGIVDVIYAGDLQGRLWKFNKSSDVWVLGNGGNPLFNARNDSGQVQPITVQPTAQLIDGKVMVYFGTGSYLEAGDLTDDTQQTFYAVSDDSLATTTVTRNNLLEQTILSSSVTTDSYVARTVSNNTTADASNRGCYLDFPATTGQPSERIASSSFIKVFTTSGSTIAYKLLPGTSGRVESVANSSSAGLPTRVIFTTATPTSDPCERSGTSWLMELGANCGRLEGTSPFDVNKDKEFNEDDLVTVGGQPATTSGIDLGKQVNPDGSITPTNLGIVSEVTWVEGGGGGGTLTPPPKRISWEQIQ